MINRSLNKLIATAVFVTAVGASSFAAAGTTGQYIDDATITTKVKAALIADAQTKALQVSVETTNGTVQLSGTVDTKGEESEAIKVANRIDGVKDVKDYISVRGAEND